MNWEQEKQFFLGLLEKAKEKYQLEEKGLELLEQKKHNLYSGVVESERPASFVLKFGGGIRSDGYGHSPNVIVIETTAAKEEKLKDTKSEDLGREMYGKFYGKNTKIRARRICND